MSPRSLYMFAQTQKSLRNYKLSTKNGSKPFRILYFYWGLCLFTFYFKCFQAHSLEVPCLTRSPAGLFFLPPSFRRTINHFLKQSIFCAESKPPHHSNGKRMQWALLFVHWPSSLWEVPLFEMNEADKSGGFKSNYPLGFSCRKFCAVLLLESKEKKKAKLKQTAGFLYKRLTPGHWTLAFTL